MGEWTTVQPRRHRRRRDGDNNRELAEQIRRAIFSEDGKVIRRSPRRERPQKNGIILNGTRSDGSLRWDEWVCGQCMKTNWLCSTACRGKGCQGRPSPAQVAAGAGLRSNVSPSKRREDATAGAKQGTTFTSPSSTVAGSSRGSISSSAAQEVKTLITKLEALLKFRAT